MEYDESFKRTVNGVEFEVFVKEDSNSRTIQVHDCEQREEEWYSYIVARDEKIAKSGGLFSEPTELPPRQQHISRVFSDAMGRYFDRKEEVERRTNEIEQALDVAEEVWNE